MSDDKMRQEFETAASKHGFSITKNNSGDYVWNNTEYCWFGFQLGCAAGRKAEREAAKSSSNRGVWVEFHTDGKRVVDFLHEPKDAAMPDEYVWCEETRRQEGER